ncbi:MAG TPA: histidine phosphatase family protein [Candidatus Eisenbacteria bacterium]|nr:histidine phosphatase family protein [Candidatus Eisenbacteria bacterium]
MRVPVTAAFALAFLSTVGILPALASAVPAPHGFEPTTLNSLARCAAPAFSTGPLSGGAASEAAVEPPAKDVSGSGAAPAPPDSVGKGKEFPPLTPRVIDQLRRGGYVIVFRHSTTDWGQRDADVVNFEDRSAQRNLSKPGEEQAATIGKAFATLGIPVGAVKASPMWRCRDTAQIAFGRHETTVDLFQRGGPSRGARVAMLSTPPDSANLVLVTHQDVLLPIVTGLRRDQLKEGDAFVVKPLGEKKFEIEAQVSPEDWLKLGVTAQKSPSKAPTKAVAK